MVCTETTARLVCVGDVDRTAKEVAGKAGAFVIMPDLSWVVLSLRGLLF